MKLLCVHDLRVQPLVQQLSWNVALLINGCFTSILSSIFINLSGNEAFQKLTRWDKKSKFNKVKSVRKAKMLKHDIVF